jgi:hypothetical protein
MAVAPKSLVDTEEIIMFEMSAAEAVHLTGGGVAPS